MRSTTSHGKSVFTIGSRGFYIVVKMSKLNIPEGENKLF
jgi:hypothetical protein